MFDFQDTDSKQADIKKSTFDELKSDECDFKSESKRSIRIHKTKFLPPPTLQTRKPNNFRSFRWGGGWAEGPACAELGARTPIGASGIFSVN